MVNRRNVLKGVATLPLLPVLGVSVPAAQAATRTARRVRPSDPAWPRAARWQELERAVGGQLTKPRALAADCEAAPADGPCRELGQNLRNPFFIGDHVSGTQVSGWLDAWTPATSAWAVAARTPADVVAAVNFARTHRLRLAVKGGGHSYQGTSNGADSLLIWTRAMNAVTLHDRFVAKDCAALQPPTPAVTVETGAMWIDAYDAVTTQAGRYVQGGGCTTVGVAGLIQSGGFGSFSKRYGTAAASLLEAEVVTADGALRTVNASRDPELFWAIKGGGGGSFGVLTKLTLRTHALPARFGAVSAKIQATTTAAFRRLVGRFVDFYATSLLNPNWGEGVSIRPDDSLEISLVSESLETAQQEAIWKPFFDWVNATADDFKFSDGPFIGSTTAQGWWDAEGRRKRGSDAMIADGRAGAPGKHAWWAGDQDQVGAFLHGYDSLWLPATLLREPERPRLVEALVAGSRYMEVRLHFNKGLAGAPPESIAAAKDTATNPAMTDSFALALIATGEAAQYPGLPGRKPIGDQAHKNAAAVDKATAELRIVAPNAGSYVSESNFFNSSWQQSFWGTNYPRLRAAKDKFDPDGLFIVHHGVGSEDWSADGFARNQRS